MFWSMVTPGICTEILGSSFCFFGKRVRWPALLAMPPKRMDSARSLSTHVERGHLARMLEEDQAIRQRLLEQPRQVLLRWPSAKATGVASVKAMVLNHRALEIVGAWWTACVEYPKTVPIDVMRDEAAWGAVFDSHLILSVLSRSGSFLCWKL